MLLSISCYPIDVDEVSHLFRVMYALTVTVKTRHCSR